MRSPELGFLLAALFAVAPALAAEPTPAEKLQQVERDRREAEANRRALEARAFKLDAELKSLRQKSVAAARALQNQEAAVTDLEARLTTLKRDEETKLAALERRRVELASTLSGLVRLGRQPPEALILAPGSAIDMVRTSQLIAATVPRIEERANSLRDELQALAAVRLKIAGEQARLGDEIVRLDRERAALQQVQEETAKTFRATLKEGGEEGKRAQLLAEEARDLRALIQRLREEEERRAAEERRIAEERRKSAEREQRQAAVAPPPPSRGGDLAIAQPARGRVVGRFGEPDRNGSARKGIDVETRVDAQVVAPSDGKIVFAGPFKGYGQLLIIAHGGGYHSLLAGFERIDATVGQAVQAGEPVGRMGGDDANKPTLYVEVRQKGEPVNPIPWLVASARKVSG